MSRTFHRGERRIRVRGVRRSDPDLRKLARALIDLAQAEAEAEAQREHGQRLAETCRRQRTNATRQRRRAPQRGEAV